jgi:hypothetical protein
VRETRTSTKRCAFLIEHGLEDPIETDGLGFAGVAKGVAFFAVATKACGGCKS